MDTIYSRAICELRLVSPSMRSEWISLNVRVRAHQCGDWCKRNDRFGVPRKIKPIEIPLATSTRDPGKAFLLRITYFPQTGIRFVHAVFYCKLTMNLMRRIFNWRRISTWSTLLQNCLIPILHLLPCSLQVTSFNRYCM
jgi:hypothetical protein